MLTDKVLVCIVPVPTLQKNALKIIVVIVDPYCYINVLFILFLRVHRFFCVLSLARTGLLLVLQEKPIGVSVSSDDFIAYIQGMGCGVGKTQFFLNPLYLAMRQPEEFHSSTRIQSSDGPTIIQIFICR